MHRRPELPRPTSRTSSPWRRWLARAFAAFVTLFVLLQLPSTAVEAQSLSGYAASTINVVAGSVSQASGYSPDGTGALSSNIIPLYVAAPDSAGNIYFIDNGAVRIVYNGTTPPPLLSFAITGIANAGGTPAPLSRGSIYTIVNYNVPASEPNSTGECSAGHSCGDGGPGILATLGTPFALAFDSQGNLYISDIGSFCIRKISVSDGTISTYAGDPLHALSTFNGDGIAATAAYLTSPGSIAFDGNDNLFVSDSGSNLVRRVDAQTKIITTVAGDDTQPGVICSDNICGEGGPATSALLYYPAGITVTPQGDLFLSEDNYVIRKVDHPTTQTPNPTINTIAGQINVPCADAVCGDGQPANQATLGYVNALALDPSGELIITDQGDNAIRALLSDGTIALVAGAITQSASAPTTQPITGVASAADFNAPFDAVLDPSGNLFIADTNFLWKVNVPVTLPPQTITFSQFPNVTYGDPPLDLNNYASVNSGLPLTFTCTGSATCSGSSLTTTGAGSFTVTASQAGDASHAPATATSPAVTVAKATLTVTPNPISFPYNGAPQLPPLTYKFSGFVDGDTSSVVTGLPVLSTTATPTSPIGEYSITLGLGTLAAANYTLASANGTLTITGGQPQTITFNALPNLTYGAPTFTLGATASSGSPVTYTVSGPAHVLGSNLTVNGAGTVTVSASQAGDAEYGPAPQVTQSFQVAPAVLTITAQSATSVYGQPNPAFTYAASGFVNGDTQAVLSGAPAFSPASTSTSVPGAYTLAISQGTLFSSNYTFAFVNSTLTIGKATQTITFQPIPDQQAGTITLFATASSGLPVQFTASAGASIVNINQVVVPVGPVTVTANQPGNDIYQAAAPVTQSFNSLKNVASYNAVNLTVPFGLAIPTLTYQINPSGTPPPANEYSGVPDLSTTATAGSPPGQYPIVVSLGTLISPVLSFQLVNGTLTILPPSSFILTAAPGSVVVPRGQARQVTITLTPVNDFVGTVTIGCSGLPAGVTCVSSPNTLTTTLDTSGVQPLTATLTISAGAPIASARNRMSETNVAVAGWLWIPSLIFGSLLMWQRRRLTPDGSTYRLLLLALLLAGFSGLTACGTSNGSSSSGLQPGTTMIQVTGGGSSTSGPASASVGLSLTIQ
jgi:MBG domain (YGX type)